MKITGGADFLQLSPAAAPVRGLTGWLADAIRVAIIDGRLQAAPRCPRPGCWPATWASRGA